MPITQITNPAAAFNEGALLGVTYFVGENTNGNTAGTIAVNAPVLLDVVSAAFTPGTNQITGALTSSNNKYLFGVAMDTIAAGKYGRVAVRGVIQAIIGTAGVTAADLLVLDTTTAGRLITAGGTVAVGTTIGVALQTQTVGLLGWMLVNKA